MPLAKILYTQRDIAQRVYQLAEQIESDLRGERPLLVAVLKGSVMFLADLVRAFDVDPDIDFMSISSYQGSPEPNPFIRSGVVRILKDVEEVIHGRHVVLVEDIVDTGLTVSYLLSTLSARDPRSLRVCTLVDKSVRRITEPQIDYSGFETEEFVVGYGLDFKGRYRNLPYLAAVSDLAALAADPDSLQGLFAEQ